MKKLSLHKTWNWQYLSCVVVIWLGLVLLTACADENTPVAPASVAATTAPVRTTTAPTPTAPPPPTSTPTVAVLPTVTPRPTTAPSATTAPVQPTNPPRLSPGATLAAGTTWPGKLVYDTTDGKIIVLNPDGGARVQVGQGNSPLFSPDGKRVAFVSPQGQDLQQAGSDSVKATITSVGLNGADRKDLCVTKPHQLMTLLRWSPRSRFIAFSAIPTNSDAGAGPVSLCNLSSGQTDSVMGSQIDVRQLYDWTPDGDNAVWQVSGLNGANYRLYYGDPDKSGDGAVPVGSDQYEVPFGLSGSGNIYLAGRISPDGKTLAVIGSQIAFFKMPGQQSPLDGKTIAGTGKGFSALAWSPDSQALAYVERNRDDPSARLEIVSLSDGQISASLKIADDASAGYQNGLDWTRQ